ncbi:MAG: hypothetical protein J1E62_03190 [Lachnospiraceae bacterium]|nr:hypothetical protein [Lachnospiraceae bacterium]
MDKKDRWEQFTDTGRVADYLAYCQHAGQITSTNNMAEGSTMGMALAGNVMWGGAVEPREVVENAGDDNSDGDDLTELSSERVR